MTALPAVVGYVSYLVACAMNEAFSEYALHEPILRSLTTHGYAVQPEVLCPGIQQTQNGRQKKFDFVAPLETNVPPTRTTGCQPAGKR